MSKPRFQTRTEYVADAIKEQILSGHLAAGKPLRQEALAEEFEVSRIPIREALLQLESQGLVKLLPHKGAVVTPLSLEEIEELFSLRSILEPHILAQAIPKITTADFEQAQSLLGELEDALDNKKNVAGWSELNHAFHRTLYLPAGKSHTLDLISTLNLRSDRYIRIQLLYTNAIDKAETEHRELLQLCKDQKITEAVALLEQHILAAGDAISELLIDSSQYNQAVIAD